MSETGRMKAGRGYPRGNGEHPDIPLDDKALRGLSPLARGTRPVHLL